MLARNVSSQNFRSNDWFVLLKYEIFYKLGLSRIFFKNKLLIFRFFFGHFEKEKKSDIMGNVASLVKKYIWEIVSSFELYNISESFNTMVKKKEIESSSQSLLYFSTNTRYIL
jgi:hypothetical protein